MDEERYKEKWVAVANDVLLVLLLDPEAWKRVFEVGLWEQDFPPGPWRETYHAIIEIRAEYDSKPNGPKHLGPAEILPKTKNVSEDWLNEILWLASDFVRWENFEHNMRTLANYGRASRLLDSLTIGLDKIRMSLDSGDFGGLDRTTYSVVDDIRAEVSGGEMSDATAEALHAEAVEILNSEPGGGITTGIPRIDLWFNGLGPGENIVIAGPYKGRKTTLWANIIKSIIDKDEEAGITFFSFDESASRFWFRILAMYVAEWFHKRGLQDVADEETGLPLNAIDRSSLMKARGAWKTWHPLQREAVQYAIERGREYKNRLRVYDASHGIRRPADIYRIMKTDSARYPTVCVGLDHVQKMPGFDKTYDAAEFGSKFLSQWAHEIGAVMWVLSQLNESTINNVSWEDAYSVGAKGGGGISSNADHVLVTRYKLDKVSDRYLRVDLRLSRDAAAPQKAWFEIHPPSGLIVRYVSDEEIKEKSNV